MTDPAETERAAVVAYLRREAKLLRQDIRDGSWNDDLYWGMFIAEAYEADAEKIENGAHLHPRKE